MAIGLAAACTTDLGGLGDYVESRATGVNDSGTIVGVSVSASRPIGPYPVRFHDDAPDEQLPLLDGDTWGRANDVNDAGTIVGASGRPRELGGGPRPVVWADGRVIDLSIYLSTPAPILDGEVTAINDGGMVAGSVTYTNGSGARVMRGFAMTHGGINRAFTSEASSVQVNDIGEDGTFVGTLDGKPMRWKGTPTTGYTELVLPMAGRTGGSATGINRAGLVVGDLDGAPVTWSIGAAEPAWLPRPAGTEVSVVASDVNDAGVIVGNSFARSGDASVVRALRWTSSESMPDELESLDPNGIYTQAFAINERGEVVGGSAVLVDNPGSAQYTATRWDPPAN